MNSNELHWVAGLLEGEGCFSIYLGKPRKDGTRRKSAKIQINMNDRDVLERLATIIGYGNVNGPYGENRNDTLKAQGYYTWGVNDSRAEDLMRQVYPLLGERRRLRIDEILSSVDRDDRRFRKS